MAEKKVWECNISPDLLESWKKVKRHGDTELMSTKFKVSVPVIQRALKYGFVTISGLSEKITDFFYERLSTESIAAQGLNEMANQSTPKKK
jgi:hypothetical protein